MHGNHSESSNDALDRYLASWAGVDGGNPGAPIWLCGIEHGGTPPFEVVELVPESEPRFWTNTFKAEHGKKEICSWPYHQKAAKLLIAVEELQKDVRLMPSFENWQQYVWNKLYVQRGNNFKMNLFPLQAPSLSEWPRIYREMGIQNKHDYRQRCRGKRFSFFSEMRRAYKPKVIIGTGITAHADFVRAFGFESSPRAEPTSISDGVRFRKCFIYKDSETTLIVSPFLGYRRYEVNSDELIRSLAKLVADQLMERARSA
jgi:transcriptional activator of eps genes